MALIYATGKEASTIDNKLRRLDDVQVRMDDEIKQLIKRTLCDMIVYGRNTQTNKCSIFEQLYEPLKNERLYLLRDVNDANAADSSLSRCSDLPSPFLFQYFKIGKPTPGTENDCAGNTFFLEDVIARSLSEDPLRIASSSSSITDNEILAAGTQVSLST